MSISHRYLKVDLVLQKVLIAIYFITGLGGFVVPGLFMLAMLIQFLIGIWQVFNAFFFVIKIQHKPRINYLIGVLAYFILSGMAGLFISQQTILIGSGILAPIGVVLIPIAFMIWYFVISNRYYQNAIKQAPSDYSLAAEMEGVLDGNEIFKNQHNDQ